MTHVLDKPTPSLKTLSKKKDACEDILKKELKKGKEEEKEHTSHDDVAEEIALDHLKEDPEYYSNLDKVKKESNTVKLSKNTMLQIINEEVQKFRLEKLHEQKYGKLLNEFANTFIEALDLDEKESKKAIQELKQHMSVFTYKLLGTK